SGSSRYAFPDSVAVGQGKIVLSGHDLQTKKLDSQYRYGKGNYKSTTNQRPPAANIFFRLGYSIGGQNSLDPIFVLFPLSAQTQRFITAIIVKAKNAPVAFHAGRLPTWSLSLRPTGANSNARSTLSPQSETSGTTTPAQ